MADVTKGKAKRRQFLINPGFQIKFVFMTVSFIGALSLVYPFILDVVMDANYSALRKVAPGADLTVFEQQKRTVLAYVFLIQVVFVLGCVAVNFFVSHRIAGPIYKLRRLFEAGWRGAEESPEVTFRKHDYFPELAEAFNQFKKVELETRQSIRQALKDPDPAQAVRRIQALLDS